MTAANARKLQSWQALHDFFSKHALGSKLPPSCLCCGQSMQDREIGVQHMELPDIVVCLQCRDRGQAQPAEAVDEADPYASKDHEVATAAWEAKEREVFEEWCAKENTVPRFKESYWKIWLARARGGRGDG